MGKLVEIKIPIYPECWETCGSCAQGDVVVEEVLVNVGDVVQFDENIVTLETGKVALDIQTAHSGTVVAIHVEEGQHVAEGTLLMTIDTGD